MKVISLTQPWATLVAIGAKQIETRSWYTSYRGPLAIHAANGFPKEARGVIWGEPFHSILMEHTGSIGEIELILPRGQIIAVCSLQDCVPITSQRVRHIHCKIVPPFTDSQEYAFGDYTPGRFAWLLSDIRTLRDPIPAKGARRLWEFPVESHI